MTAMDTSRELVEEPLVSLVKPASDTSAGVGDEDDGWWDDDDAGGELVVRPDDDLVPYEGGHQVPARRQVQELVVRARQATARGVVLVVDQPLVSRSLAVGRQSPYVVGRLMKWTPRGAKRAVLMLGGWLNDSRSSTLLAKHSDAGEGEAYARVADARAKTNLAGRRAMLTSIVAILVLVALAWWAPAVFAGVLAALVFAGGLALAVRHTGKELAWALVLAAVLAWVAWAQGPTVAALVPQPPTWFWWVAGGALVVWFGLLGRQDDQKLVEMPATEFRSNAAPNRPTATMVVDALCRLGITGMTPTVIDQVREETRVIAPGVGRSKRGWHLQLELPWAVTAGQVMDKREQLAAALKRELGTVWPTQGPRHPGHLVLFLADRPMATSPQDRWSVTEGGRVDIFNSLEMFTDQEGRWVDLQIAYKRILIGGESGSGKSFYARQIGVTCAFDPRVRIVVFDGKANGDMDPLIPVAHGFYIGAQPEEMAQQLAAAQAIEREMDRRARFLRTLPREENPENKVTSALVDRYPDLAPYLVIVDELQEYTQAEDKTMAKEFTRIFTRFSRLGRSAGIIPVIATQYPADGVVPVAMRSNFSTKFCLRVEGHQQVEVILGTGSYGAGLQANKFTASEAGLAWHKGDGQEPSIVRSVYGLDGPACDELIERARLLRASLGMLTGQAADDGVVDAEVVYRLADDVERVLRDHGRDSAQWEELLPWVRDLREQYSALTKEELSAGIRSARVRVADVRVAGATRKGVYLADLQKRAADDGVT